MIPFRARERTKEALQETKTTRHDLNKASRSDTVVWLSSNELDPSFNFFLRVNNHAIDLIIVCSFYLYWPCCTDLHVNRIRHKCLIRFVYRNYLVISYRGDNNQWVFFLCSMLVTYIFIVLSAYVQKNYNNLFSSYINLKRLLPLFFEHM